MILTNARPDAKQSAMHSAFFEGAAVGGGLIIAIGAQNAFVISQAVRRQHALLVASLCWALDVVLILGAVAGAGTLVASHPWLTKLAAVAGALFLIVLGWRALRSAFGARSLEMATARQSRRAVLLSVVAVTLLNPHAYLDVLMLGTIAGQHPGFGRYVFGFGAITASLVWFFGLSLFGGTLAPLFTTARAWRVLDLAVCATVWFVGVTLLVRVFG